MTWWGNTENFNNFVKFCFISNKATVLKILKLSRAAKAAQITEACRNPLRGLWRPSAAGWLQFSAFSQRLRIFRNSEAPEKVVWRILDDNIKSLDIYIAMTLKLFKCIIICARSWFSRFEFKVFSEWSFYITSERAHQSDWFIDNIIAINIARSKILHTLKNWIS